MNSNKANSVPTILLAISTLLYVVGIFLPWQPNGYSFYKISELTQSLSSHTDVTNGIESMGILLIFTTISIAIVSTILQFVNYKTKNNACRIVSILLAFVTPIVSMLTFLGGYLLVTILGDYDIQPGVIVTATGALGLFISAIVAIKNNKPIKH